MADSAFSSIESLLYLLAEGFFPGIKASRQQEPEVVVTGSKNFAGVSMGLVGEQLSFPPLVSCTHGS